MRFIEAWTYFLGDKQWPRKLGSAILLAAIPLLGYFIIKGWEFEISVQVRHGRPTPLPGLGNMRGRLWRGLIIRFAGFVYNIPTVALLAFNVVLWVSAFATFFSGEPQTWERLGAVLGHQLPLRLGLLGLTIFYGVSANILYWSGYLRYIETRDFLDFFDIITNIKLAFATIWDDLVATVYFAIVNIAASLLSSAMTAGLSVTGVGAFIAPVLVPALFFALTSVFSGHIYGQLAIRTLDKVAVGR